MNDPETLLEHASWLRRLAASLVGDGSVADDLVQETWVAALRHPPAQDRPVRPWLRHVLKNVARFRWRSETNRSAREKAVAAMANDEAPSSEALLERHETQQLLARLVTELEEPFRATILLRYAEGLAPSEIARRLGVPASTIRSRLKEGLERLRLRLDALHRGDRRAWIVAFAPLAKGMPAAAKVSPWPLLVALALALVIGVSFLVVRIVRSEDTVAAQHDDQRESISAPATLRSSDRAATLAADKPPGWVAQEGAPARRIAGRVLVDGVPTAGVLVRLTSELSVTGLAPLLEQRTTVEGRFDFGVHVARDFIVAASAPSKLAAIQHVDIRDPNVRADAIELGIMSCVVSFYGTVRDASGTPIAHAELLREEAIGTETDAAGAYELCVLPTAPLRRQLRLSVRADGYGTDSLIASPSGRVRHDFVLTPAATVSGRALLDGGAPAANAEIWIEPDDVGVEPIERARVLAATDAEGRFRIGALTGGRYRIGASSRGGSATPVLVAIGAGESQDIVLKLAANGVIHGRVLRDGHPVAGARVSPREDTTTDAVSQSDGSFVLDRVPVGDVTLTAAPFRVRSPASIRVAGGDQHGVILEVEPQASLRGTVRRHGVPVPSARVHIVGPTRMALLTDLSGRYQLDGLEAGEYFLHSDDTRLGAFVDLTLKIASGEQREFDIDLLSGARIKGVVVDAQAKPVAGAFVLFKADTMDEGRCVTTASGNFDCGSMTGGTYAASVFPSEHGSMPLRFVGDAPQPVAVADGDAVVDGVRLVVEPRQLAIRGAVFDTSGSPMADVEVRTLRAPESNRWMPTPSAVTDSDGTFQIDGLAPGSYSLEARTLAGARTVQPAIAGASGVKLVVDTVVCRDGGDLSRIGVLHDEPKDIASRPPGTVVWDARIQLVGWSVAKHVALGDKLEVTVYYKVLAPVSRSWQMFVHIDGKQRVNADHEPLDGRCPTSTWRAGDFIVDRFTASFDRKDLTAGDFTVWIGFFTGWAPNWKNMPVSEAPADLRDTHEGIKLGIVTAN